jgi:hypothetical protein
MRILCIGDVVGSIGCEFLRNNLPTLKKVNGVDFVICNGENSADGNGLTPVSAKHLFDSGVDAITLGNHSFRDHLWCDRLESGWIFWSGSVGGGYDRRSEYCKRYSDTIDRRADRSVDLP